MNDSRKKLNELIKNTAKVDNTALINILDKEHADAMRKHFLEEGIDVPTSSGNLAEDIPALRQHALENKTVPVFDGYGYTAVPDGSIAVLYFSEVNKDGSDFKFGLIIGLDPDKEIRWRKERCFDIIKATPLNEMINDYFPGWLENYVPTGWLVDWDIKIRDKYINYKAPYHFSFPSIAQFKGVCGDLCHHFNNQPIDLIGLTKINGVNATLIFTGDEIIKQSKEKTITVYDQYGFAHHIEKHEEELKLWGEHVRALYELEYPFVIAGEWAGKGVINKSSVGEVMPFLAVFLIGQVKEELSTETGENVVEWQRPSGLMLNNGKARIFDIREFGTWSVKFDPGYPANAQKQLAEITGSVEAACPAAAFFGIESGIGEGVVWHPNVANLDVDEKFKRGGSLSLYFKVKGSKHSNVKVRRLASPNPERLENVNKFLEYVLTENRFEQGVRETGDISKQNMGKFLSWVAKDVMKEEMDTLKASGLEWDNISKPLTSTAMSWYKSKW